MSKVLSCTVLAVPVDKAQGYVDTEDVIWLLQFHKVSKKTLLTLYPPLKGWMGTAAPVFI